MSGMVMSETFDIADAVFTEIDADLYAALHLGAEFMVEEAQMLVPVDTGALYDSIRVDWLSDDSFEFIADAENTSGVQYAFFVEFGTRFMAAQPFFEPAYEAGVAKIQELIDELAGKY